MEEVVEECLEELVGRNLVLVVKKSRYDGKIKTSSIHDVLRDLCLSQAQNEKFLYRHRGSSEIDNDSFLRIIKDQPRRVVNFPYVDLESSISYNSHIRTFRAESYRDYDQLSGTIAQFKLLRVLGTVRWSSAALRNSVRLNNLRYLHLDALYMKESSPVPKSISKLRNLETLFLSGSASDDENYYLILPVEIWEMPRLRHIIVSKYVKVILPPFPEDDSITESSSLQTLTSLYNFYDFSPRVIQKLQQNLKKLQIKYNFYAEGNIHYLQYYFNLHHLEDLVNLHHLEDLTFFGFPPHMTNIGFPINLKKLSLERTHLPWEKMTSIGDLIHLQKLKLGHYSLVGKVWEPIEGGFPQLKCLNMEFLDLEEWRAESTHFPSLQKLVILQCYRLKEVPTEIGDIDTLQKLIVKKSRDDDVGRGFEESVRRIQEEQQRVGNHWLQVVIMSQEKYFRHDEVVNRAEWVELIDD